LPCEGWLWFLVGQKRSSRSLVILKSHPRLCCPRIFATCHLWKYRHRVYWILWYSLVVYRSSETSTNQSDVIIRSDDRFLNLVVDSCLTLFFGWFSFLSPYWQKYCRFIPAVFFALILTTSGNFVQAYFWHSVNTHIWTSLLFIYFPE
jgi:hypothetical protein